MSTIFGDNSENKIYSLFIFTIIFKMFGHCIITNTPAKADKQWINITLLMERVVKNGELIRRRYCLLLFINHQLYALIKIIINPIIT